MLQRNSAASRCWLLGHFVLLIVMHAHRPSSQRQYGHRADCGCVSASFVQGSYYLETDEVHKVDTWRVLLPFTLPYEPPLVLAALQAGTSA